jgi:hypothetical protein
VEEKIYYEELPFNLVNVALFPRHTPGKTDLQIRYLMSSDRKNSMDLYLETLVGDKLLDHEHTFGISVARVDRCLL